MKRNGLVASIVALVAASGAFAAPTAEQVQQLGTTLTPWGAEIAGNKEGTIPAYSGGVTKAPPGFDLAEGKWVDPYPDDKPLFSITAANMAQYADKLTPAAQEMLKRWPTFRIDVYPTRRSFPAMDKFHAEAAIRNAKNPDCKMVENDLRGCQYATPFPIPATGYEVMWNHLLHQRMPASLSKLRNTVFDSTGAQSAPTLVVGTYDAAYWDPNSKPYDGLDVYFARSLTLTLEPSRDAGTTNMQWYSLRPDKDDQRSWSYTTGQRRVRLAPEFTYDTPIMALGGVLFFDEAAAFAGRMDRFDFKLVGKKEMYVPYNSYKAIYTPREKAYLKHHMNPDAMRWELHRVWVVEATLKQGQRHAMSKRRFYVDEDSWHVLANEGYDQGGKLMRAIFTHSIPNYSGVGGGMLDFSSSLQAYDLSRGNWVNIGNAYGDGYWKPVQRTPEFAAKFSPQAIAGAAVR